jgi:hypothetical protein
MTICIASICDLVAPKIVACTDLMGSNPLGNKNVVKDKFVAANWHFLTAGSDDEINATMHKLISRIGLQSHIDETNIIPTFSRLLKSVRLKSPMKLF